MNTRKIIPYRIKQARVSRGFSMGELADLLNVSRSAISQYELGTISPSDYIIGLMSNVLNYPISFFTKKLPETNNASSAVYFRSRRTSSQKAKNAAREKISIFREINDYLSSYIDFPNVNFPDIEYETSCYELSLDVIESYALLLRKYWKLGKGPIDNLTSVLQKNGIMISVMDLNNKKIDAFSVWHNSIPYIFRSNDKYSNARLRFDLAHELGHLLLHANTYREEDLAVKVISEKLEKEADMFAACFLLPAETFSQDIYSTSINHFIQLKKKWKVSIGAMIYRCSDLGLLSENQIKYLKDQMTYNKYWHREPLDDIIPLETPTAHKQAFELLLDNDIVTPSEIVETIGCFASEIEEYSFLPRGTLKPAQPTNIIRLKDHIKFSNSSTSC